jgi:hypothetical protein
MDAFGRTSETVNMPTMRSTRIAHVGATGRLAEICAEMAVEDVSGERIGRVIHVQVGAATDGGSGPSHEGRHSPNLPSDLAERLLRVGYIKIADTRYFRRDFRYYVTIDQVLSVQASVVRLDGFFRDCITAFD